MPIGTVQPPLLDGGEEPDLLSPHPPTHPLHPPRQFHDLGDIRRIQLECIQGIDRGIEVRKHRLSTRISKGQNHARIIRRGYDSQPVSTHLKVHHVRFGP